MSEPRNYKTIFDYFSEEIEYPEKVIDEILPYNILWSYVPSNFVNTFVNQGKAIKVYQIDRYTTEETYIEGVLMENHKEYIGTKSELRESVIRGSIKFWNTNLSIFEDDIIILSAIEMKDGMRRFLFCYFDQDTSDCMIGRFETSDSTDAVIESLENWLKDEKEKNKDRIVTDDGDAGMSNYHELPLSFLEGWLKF